jgi:hypothetical protein
MRRAILVVGMLSALANLCFGRATGLTLVGLIGCLTLLYSIHRWPNWPDNEPKP